MNSSAFIKMVQNDGWYLERTKGTHHHFKHSKKKGLVTILYPKKDVPKGTVKSILKQAGIRKQNQLEFPGKKINIDMENKIKVFVEKAEDGTYWGTTQNIPGVVSAFGNTLEELKGNLKVAFEDYIEVAEKENEYWVKEVNKIVDWDYQMDIQSFFHLIPEVKISAIGRKAKINESLMRQYVTGKAAASEERVKLIEKAIHELGRELQSVSF